MRPASTLMITSMLVALIWRVEVELRGWDGLAWIGYTHLAIPLGGMLFLGLVRLVSRSNESSQRIIGLVAIWGVIAWLILQYAANAYFVGGMAAISYMITLGALFYHIHWVSPVIWGSSILVLYGGYRLFFRFPPRVWIGGFALWMGSWHFGLIIISILPERGYDDLIHSLKTGWMIPFCVAAVGMPLLVLSQRQSAHTVAHQPA